MMQNVETPGPEEQIARVTILADEGLLQPVVDFAHRVSVQLGLDATSAGRLDVALERVCRNVIKTAFEPDDDGRFDVQILRRPGQVVVAVEDRGLPFDYASLREGEALGEARFVNLGRRGNRVELVGRLARSDVRDRLPEEEHREATSAPAATPAATQDAPLEIRTMRPEESFELSRCVYRSYGYSYDWDDIYYPDRIRALQEADLMRSCVAVTPEGEFAGHLAVVVDRPDAPVGEGGQAVVHPRYRGHHLFPRLKTFMTERIADRGMYGIYSEATAVHPYSQKGSLGLGARETGFLLGYIPASVSYKDIGEDREGRRGSVALIYTRTNEEPHRPIYPPAAYREATLRVVEHNNLRRAIESEPDDDVPPASRISVVARPDHNIAFPPRRGARSGPGGRDPPAATGAVPAPRGRHLRGPAPLAPGDVPRRGRPAGPRVLFWRDRPRSPRLRR